MEAWRERLEPGHFLSPGALWWVFDWAPAEEQCGRGRKHMRRPERPSADWTLEQGSVLLIDEIDKAEADLPNGLL